MAKQLAMIGLAILAVFGAGWKVGDWYRDSLDLVIDRAATAAGDKARSESQKIASQSGRELETKLQGLKDAWPAEIRAELVNPVFDNGCLSYDFVRMYNTAAENAERTLSRKPINKMPGNNSAP
ncbi:hypothetical protein F4W05_13295 [Ewingella americana]|uniref:DUF2570 domain-containing protein n=1 Tax=Ewingella americana TaxID=41202 RepID=A0A377N719_9GAMM|nr:hypothetical protein [Ewingella americana]KAA8727587.1 hypothetical protein F4W05_13295 [Ewingella americana]STQ42870.1 Uncharacterised protein [Ewingella americana]